MMLVRNTKCSTFPSIQRGYNSRHVHAHSSRSAICSRLFSSAQTSEKKPFRVAIVGSGPAAWYATEILLKNLPPPSSFTFPFPSLQIDILEKLPVPFGLVRFGVAPDHPEVKVVIHQFEKLVTDGKGAGVNGTDLVRFFGNVEVGSDISVAELQQAYHSIILAYGADDERNLDIPGEDFMNVWSARKFVAWYNGHPDFVNQTFNLKKNSASVIGQGNVALDVGRLLLKNVDDLKETDISHHALEVLAESTIKDVHIIGRRGPAQAAFTTKELREMTTLKDVRIVIDDDELELNEASKAEVEAERSRKRQYDLLLKLANAKYENYKKTLYFHFLKSPKQLMSGDGKNLSCVLVEKNRLIGTQGNQKAVGTGSLSEIPSEILFKSIGYKSVPVEGILFDKDKGVISNVEGRVIDKNGEHVPGLYVTGWLKRGPSGIIGTNKLDAMETVQSLLDDLKKNKLSVNPVDGFDAFADKIKSKKTHLVTFDDWKKLDEEEVRRGKEKGKAREKMVHINEVIDFLKK